MEDLLGKAKWWNLPLANPTQNVYRRFKRTPWSKLPDKMGDAQDLFMMTSRLKTKFTGGVK